MPDPVPPPGDRSPSGPTRAARQDHAVLAWLVVEADLPSAVYTHLLNALLAWAPLMGEHLFTTSRKSASTPTCAMCWEACGGGSMPRPPRPAGRTRSLNEVRGRVGLAMQALRTHAPGLPGPGSPGG